MSSELNRVLPEPRHLRWKPLRSGLVDLYRYDDQEFLFEDGRLLLRGNNGTGKSRVLALQLPFLLDGDVAPHRLEPDGDPAKRIEWNLLLGREEQRRGYTWIEFGRRDEDGQLEYVTLGCWLFAIKGKSGVQKLFFMTAKRVGVELLLHENRVALSKDRLKAAILPDGQVHDTLDGWRHAVDQKLFGLGPRYKPLLDLLIELRKPQLSRNLDEGKLSGALSSALPPLSPRVVEPLAQAFRSLEDDRAQLEGLRASAAATEEFLLTYKAYAAVAARRRSENLRRTHSAYELANRKVIEAQRLFSEAQVRLEQAQQGAQAAQEREQEAATRVRTLELAPAMNRVHDLDHAANAASLATGQHDKALERLRLAQARERERFKETEAARNSAETAVHTEANRRAVLAVEAGPLGLDVEAELALWNRALEVRKKAAEQLKAAETALAGALAKLTQATQRHADRGTALDAAREAEGDAARANHVAAERLVAAFAAWRPLTLAIADPEAVLAELQAWLEAPTGSSPIQAAVARAFSEALGAVEQARAGLQQRRGDLDGQRKVATDEQRALEQGGHAPPTPPPTRHRQPDRPGAPLWQLCDFLPEVPDVDRRGLEAALQAAGLLDAWVTPSGDVLAPGMQDAALTLNAPVAGNSVSCVLVALDHPQVPRAVAAGVLERIGLAGMAADGADCGAVWVDATGRYRLGPLQGAWTKPAAEHIGETARDLARRKRLQELAEFLADLDAQLLALQVELTALTQRESRIKQEARDQPDDSPVRDAASKLRTAQGQVALRQKELVEAERELLARRDDEVLKRDVRDVLARDLALDAWRGRTHELDLALSQVRGTAEAYYGARHLAQDRGRALQRATDLHAQASQELSATTATAAETDALRREAAVHHATLKETYGAEAHEILASLAAAKLDLTAAHASKQSAEKEHREATGVHATADANLSTTNEKVAATLTDREAHIGAVTALATTGLLTVLDVPVPDLPLSTTRTVELARALEDRLATTDMDDTAWSRVQDGLHADFELLRRAMLEQRLDPALRTLDDLAVVEVLSGDRMLRLPDLRAHLTDELRLREATLTAQERTVIENHLIGDLATELHDLIHRGEALVRSMSQEVEQRATSTGMRLKFAWTLREDVSGPLAEARKRLMRKGATWSTQDRDLIADFLKGRLDDVRAQSSDLTWQEHIEKAFDYRTWHGFVVERYQDGQWKPLTRRTHGTGSGGEKAIALTIPQLAAAAAFYRGAHPHAPRLILLDEAFVGVDNDMRAKCMGLFAEFDLDFVMTSEREWGCYATLPGVAICQLAAQPGIDAVDVVRWVWNGRERKLA